MKLYKLLLPSELRWAVAKFPTLDVDKDYYCIDISDMLKLSEVMQIEDRTQLGILCAVLATLQKRMNDAEVHG